MSTFPTPGPLTFRARRSPVWLCFGLSLFLLLVGALGAFATRSIGTPDAARHASAGPGLVLLVIVGVPALFIFWLGNNLRRSKVVISDDGVDVRVNRFRIWAIRPLGSARLSWRDIHGIQAYEIPNFTSRTGVQVDYVLHTAQGAFAVSSIQFTEAERIAALIAKRIGREVGDLPSGITPVGADRRGIRLMRALGWVSLVSGFVFPGLLFMIWLRGSPIEAGTIGGVAMTSGALLMLGRWLRRFSLK